MGGGGGQVGFKSDFSLRLILSGGRGCCGSEEGCGQFEADLGFVLSGALARHDLDLVLTP